MSTWPLRCLRVTAPARRARQGRVGRYALRCRLSLLSGLVGPPAEEPIKRRPRQHKDPPIDYPRQPDCQRRTRPAASSRQGQNERYGGHEEQKAHRGSTPQSDEQAPAELSNPRGPFLVAGSGPARPARAVQRQVGSPIGGKAPPPERRTHAAGTSRTPLVGPCLAVELPEDGIGPVLLERFSNVEELRPAPLRLERLLSVGNRLLDHLKDLWVP